MIALAGCMRLLHGSAQSLKANEFMNARVDWELDHWRRNFFVDKIFIHALKTEAIVGIFDWERQVKQTVVIDLEFSADIRKAALTRSTTP